MCFQISICSRERFTQAQKNKSKNGSTEAFTGFQITANNFNTNIF